MADRVRDGFGNEAGREFAQGYLELVLQTWREAETARRRTTLLVITLIVAFQLLATSEIQELTLGPFKLNDLTVARALLPAAIAHLFYEWLALSAAAFRYRWAVDDVVRITQPEVWRNGLHWLLAPGMLSLVGRNDWEKLRAPGTQLHARLLRVRTLANGLIIVAFVAGATGFFIYAYVRLFGLHTPGWVTWASLTFTVISLVRCATLAIDEQRAAEMVAVRPAAEAPSLPSVR